MWRLFIVSYLVIGLVGCSALRGSSNPDSFIMFFVSGSVEIPPEAQQIVGRAAANAKAKKASAIEIAVPPDAPGGAHLFERRVSAIENVLSAEGIDPKLFIRRPLSKAETSIPGAGGRAEITIVQR
jgi:hypothetical protein